MQNILLMLKDKTDVDWNRRMPPEGNPRNSRSPLSVAMKMPDMKIAKILLSVPSIKVDLNYLLGAGVKRSVIRQCLGFLQKENERTQSLIFSLSVGLQVIPECRVCLVQFSANGQVFHCSNGHYTCGTCKPRIQVLINFVSFGFSSLFHLLGKPVSYMQTTICWESS